MHPNIVRFQQTVQWLSQKWFTIETYPQAPEPFQMTRWVDTSHNLVK